MRLAALSSDTMTPEQVGLYREILSGPRGQGPRAILLDTGNPTASLKELGGTGRTHDWAVSRRIRETVPVPIFLAGGLRPDNVAEAVRVVQPFAVDVCSGLRSQGALDPVLLHAFFRELGETATVSARVSKT